MLISIMFNGCLDYETHSKINSMGLRDKLSRLVQKNLEKIAKKLTSPKKKRKYKRKIKQEELPDGIKKNSIKELRRLGEPSKWMKRLTSTP